MAFKFSLETLLRVRQRMLEMAEMELSKAISKKKSIETQYEKAALALQKEREELKRVLEEGVMASEFNMRIQLINQMEQNLNTLKERLREAEIQVAQARGNLKQRHTDCELVKNLRQRQLKKYLKEVDARLQKELDELVAMKHARLMGGGE